MWWKYELLQFLIWCSKWLNFLLKFLFGYSLYSGNQKIKKNSKFKANRCKVLWRAFPVMTWPFSTKSFFLLHKSYEDAEYVLKNKNVSLLHLSRHQAVFVSIPKNTNPYSHHTCGPFLYVNQYNHCDEVLTMPIDSFVSLMKRAKRPSEKGQTVIYISNTSRSGSTLLTHMLDKLPNTMTIAEPNNCIDFLAFEDHQLRSQVLEASVKMLVHPIDAKVVAVKIRGLGSVMMAKLAKVLPEIHHVFNYRDALPNIISLTGLGTVATNTKRKIDSYLDLFPKVIPDAYPSKDQVLESLEDLDLDSLFKAQTFSWGIKMLSFHHYMASP